MPKELTSFDDVRRAIASRELLWTRALIFLNAAITDIGTAHKIMQILNNYASLITSRYPRFSFL